jgi:hypothetical protein
MPGHRLNKDTGTSSGYAYAHTSFRFDDLSIADCLSINDKQLVKAKVVACVVGWKQKIASRCGETVFE